MANDITQYKVLCGELQIIDFVEQMFDEVMNGVEDEDELDV